MSNLIYFMFLVIIGVATDICTCQVSDKSRISGLFPSCVLLK